MHKSNLLKNKLHYMLETPKALSTNKILILSYNLKDNYNGQSAGNKFI